MSRPPFLRPPNASGSYGIRFAGWRFFILLLFRLAQIAIECWSLAGRARVVFDGGSEINEQIGTGFIAFFRAERVSGGHHLFLAASAPGGGLRVCRKTCRQLQAGLMRAPSVENAMPKGLCIAPKASTPPAARTITAAQAARNVRILPRA
jgi:hypothetical protein